MTDQEMEKLLDELNKEFAEALSLILIDPDDVMQWGGSVNAPFEEFLDAFSSHDKLMIDVRGMPIWHFRNGKVCDEIFLVKLTQPGMEIITLFYNPQEAKAGEMLDFW